MSKKRVVRVPHKGVTPEQARSLRARAWAFVFSCWRAKREDGIATTSRRPEGEKDKEVSHVDHFSVEPSDIVHPQFTKEDT